MGSGSQSDVCKRLLWDELSFLKAMYTAEELEINEPEDSEGEGQVTQLLLRQQVDSISYEVMIQLSSEYPIILKPSAFVRSSSINCDLLNRELRYFIEHATLGVPLTLAIIQWISDSISRFKELAGKQTVEVMKNMETASKIDTKYARIWIYSHHIYNKLKRRIIKDTASVYQLNGFFCPGKPGVIIVEGSRNDCDKFWEQIRVLNWQRIVLRYCEEQTDPSFFRFGKFREMQFPPTKYLSELKKMLTESGLEYGFSLLLNL
uniref:Small nuclear ribonucleoprotein Prp3 C-terminal domain-containing protein n=1 Tax=Setaria digitata TaxID=48799 RepID=A0A915Q2L5_9BILA